MDSAPRRREDWQPGDLAECTHAGQWFRDGVVPNNHGPLYSEVCPVSSVSAERCPLTGKIEPMLRFERYRSRLFPGRCFLKVAIDRKEQV